VKSRSPVESTAGGVRPKTDRYLVTAVLRACDLIHAFQTDGEFLSLGDLSARTGLNKVTVFRLMRTLEKCGFVDGVANHRYRLNIKPLRRRKWRIGYAALGAEFALSRELTESLNRAAADEAVELIVLDNRNSSKVALTNADLLVEKKVDLVIEHQSDEHVAPMIGSKYVEAKIPFIAINIPHPGATYYGANNYSAGLIAGRYLAHWAKQRWHGQVGGVILVGRSVAGPLLNFRLRGAEVGIREVLPGLDDSRFVYLDSRDGRFGSSLDVMRRYLRHKSPDRILVSTISDPIALGALRAFEESGRASDCAIVGQAASFEARAQLRQPNTRLIGSVGYFPEKYGEGVILLALTILNRKSVPPAVLIKHHLITPENVNHFYPNDALMGIVDVDSMVLGYGEAVPAFRAKN
jgi:ribose transport system substrate-binding protein